MLGPDVAAELTFIWGGGPRCRENRCSWSLHQNLHVWIWCEISLSSQTAGLQLDEHLTKNTRLICSVCAAVGHLLSVCRSVKSNWTSFWIPHQEARLHPGHMFISRSFSITRLRVLMEPKHWLPPWMSHLEPGYSESHTVPTQTSSTGRTSHYESVNCPNSLNCAFRLATSPCLKSFLQ